MYRTFIAVLLIAALSSNAQASRRTKELKPKSPHIATACSFFGTAIPLALAYRSLRDGDGSGAPGMLMIVFGSAFGPGLGHGYAGNSNKCFKGAGLRLALWGGTIMIAGAAASSDSGFGPSGGTVGALLIGMGVIGISCIYDITTASRSAEEYNRKHGLARVSVKPTYNFADNTAGLQLTVRL